MESHNKTSEILVTGGTGLLGKAVCEIFAEKNVPVTIGTHNHDKLKNNTALIDFESGIGMHEALAGKKIILHLASDKKYPDHDVSGTKKMLEAIKQNGQHLHFIYISIVGIEKLPLPYFKQKLLTEQEVIKSGVPYSILRATQFHEYIDQLLHQFLKMPFIGFLPKQVPIQPIDVVTVAQQLFQITNEQPTFNMEEIGGKEVMPFAEAVSSLLAVKKQKKVLLNIPLWGEWGKNLKAGALVTKKSVLKGRTWQQWLKEHYA